ncbi:Transposase [Collimonas sp. OK607]|uniref:IS21 family transposase n=1 Tax=Collimonas sp. OK607 TaxID=1798194 RepID=UPI0008E33CD0|nr:IS21 family transposase [Collimonas sp. OK607]SFB13867.1 Transposase [Collimonas sp. OK607]
MYVLKQHLQTTVITLLAAGKSQREIERITGVNRKTIRSLAQRTDADVSNYPGVATGSDPQITPPRPPTISSGPVSACEPHRAFIEAQLRLRRNYTAIYQDLVDQFGFTAAYNSVKRFAGTLVAREPEQFDRLEFAPGEEVQVDYGEGAMTRVPGSDQYRRPRLFVMTLRYSRRCFRRVVWKSSQETWARLHEEAWRYFGGCPSYVVLDNLREGVIKPDLYEPELNPVYSAMLAHYGVVADPARVRDPNRKGTVENAIQHTQSTALKGRRFESIEEQNAFLERWETKWAALRIHGSVRRQVEAMFQEERTHLKPLPLQGFQYFTECERTVADDTCIRIDHSSYAARPAMIGSRVLVRLFEHHIEIRNRHTHAVLRTHPRAQRPGSVLLPDDERPFNPSRETRRILAQAEDIGPDTLRLCQQWFDKEGRVGQRKLWGIVNLVKRYPRRLIDQACAQALRENVCSYKSIQILTERLLVAALAEIDAPVQGELDLTQQHPLIRDGDDYADLFTLGAQNSAALPPTKEPSPS